MSPDDPTSDAAYLRALTYDLEEARDAMSRGHVRTATSAVDRALARPAPGPQDGPRCVVMTALAMQVVPSPAVSELGGKR